MPCNNCEAPTSETTVYNYTSAASSWVSEALTRVSATVYSFTGTPAEGASLFIYVDGVMQLQDTDYTMDFTACEATFDEDIPAGSNVTTVYIGAE